MHATLLIAALLGAASTEMQTLAASPAEGVVVSVDLDADLVKNGADKEALHTQVELALRRCGFTVNEITTINKEITTIKEITATYATVEAISMPASPGRGWVAAVLFKVRTLVLGLIGFRGPRTKGVCGVRHGRREEAATPA